MRKSDLGDDGVGEESVNCARVVVVVKVRNCENQK